MISKGSQRWGSQPLYQKVSRIVAVTIKYVQGSVHIWRREASPRPSDKGSSSLLSFPAQVQATRTNGQGLLDSDWQHEKSPSVREVPKHFRSDSVSHIFHES